MNLNQVLSGEAGLAGVQDVLLGFPARTALRHALRALLPDPAVLGSCRLRRAKFKPDRKLTAYYDVTLRAETSGARSIRPIAVTWLPPGSTYDTSPQLFDLQAEAQHRSLADPFRQLMADLPMPGSRLLIAPLDPHFPQLVRLSDPQYVSDMIATAAAMPASTITPSPRYAVNSIRYRPGQRHVLRYDLVSATDQTKQQKMIFAKLYRGEDGARAQRIAMQLGDWLTIWGSSVSAVRPLAYTAADASVLYPDVAGVPLSEHLRRSTCAMAGWLEQAATALQVLHRAPPTLTGELTPHDLTAEIKAIARASEHVHALLPHVGATIDALLHRVYDAYARLPAESPACVHGDFKADHLWVTPTGLTLIDFDTCRLADPALDVGKFLADLCWWYDTLHRSDVEQAQAHFLEAYARGVPRARLLRARLYEVIVLIKITVRRVPLFDRDWISRTERLIGRAEGLFKATANAR